MPPPHKRRKVNQVEEITFDPTARHEYLTGFHKRKQERAQHARDAAAKKAREEKVKERRELREKRRDDLERHVAAVKAELQKQKAEVDGEDSSAEDVNGENDEWNGVEDGVGLESLEQDEEFVYEDKYTTVTVEAMDVTGNDSEDDDGREKVEEVSSKQVNGHTGSIITEKTTEKRLWSKDPNDPNAAKKKKKKKQFRYESKAERQAGRQKQKLKNRAAKARREGK